MGQSQQKADRSDGKADAKKLKVKEGPAATADSTVKGSKSGASLQSCCFAVRSAATQAVDARQVHASSIVWKSSIHVLRPMQ